MTTITTKTMKYLRSTFCSVSNEVNADCDSFTAFKSAVKTKSNRQIKFVVPPQRLMASLLSCVLFPKSWSRLSMKNGTKEALNVGSGNVNNEALLVTFPKKSKQRNMVKERRVKPSERISPGFV